MHPIVVKIVGVSYSAKVYIILCPYDLWISDLSDDRIQDFIQHNVYDHNGKVSNTPAVLTVINQGPRHGKKSGEAKNI